MDQVVRPWAPHPPSQVQREFLALNCEEALYGGAAGGGKTDALLMAALQYVDRPGYSAALFRRHELDWDQPGSALQLANQWLAGTSAKWDARARSWVFPSGATIHFGFASNYNAMVSRYQGAVFQFIGFDELTQWPEVMYLYLFSRVRRLITATDIPTRIRGACNPGGLGHQWVKRRFVADAKHVVRGSDARADIKNRKRGHGMPEPRCYESPPSDEARRIAQEEGKPPQGAFFVPAFLEDNPGLDQADYRRKLSKLDPVTRAQLGDADWDTVSSGNFFAASDLRIIKTPPIGLQWIRSWDFAATVPEKGKDPDWTAGAKLAIQMLPNQEHRLIIGHMRRFQLEPGNVEIEVQGQAKTDGRNVPVILEQEPGSSGKAVIASYRTRVLFGFQVHSYTRTGPKEEYWKPVASLARAGGVEIVEGPWNQTLLEELTNIPVGHDDQADTIGGGFAWLTEKGTGAMRTRALAGLG